MEFDLVLPITVFLILISCMLVHKKLQRSVYSLFTERKLGIYEVIILVISLGVITSVIAYAPSNTVQITFLAVYSYVMFSLAYITSRRWYLALLFPTTFLLLYLCCWNFLIADFFAAFMVILVTAYMGSLFSWKTILIFATLLTVMDIIQVFVTGLMGEAATKMVLVLHLPVAVVLPTFPRMGYMMLGLGDIFLAGLLSIQTLKDGWFKGALTAAGISFAIFVFQIFVFNVEFSGAFPATIIVVAGWMLGLMLSRTLQLIQSKIH
ncbi:MAG: hypothetical protein RMJ07_01835 [Nitrososphaerota archaeon]|nr:hypothetical protein [Candidatus Bathyarchaeota archaeon]MDW8048409.1 hypothetical protein [Nitrososphaerota archaeon]